MLLDIGFQYCDPGLNVIRLFSEFNNQILEKLSKGLFVVSLP